MKDWNAIAAASGAGIPAGEIDRVAKPLASLEASFRPLAASLRFDDEPAPTFHPAEDGE
jgi:hypothetical protein